MVIKRGLLAIVFLGIFLFIVLVSAIPQILVNSPASSPFYTTNTSVELNFSIIESNLGSLIYNWNSTNFTLYNDSLVLMMNFDNNSLLGENSTKAVDVSRYGNNGTANALNTGLISAENLNDALFDYLLLSKGNPKQVAEISGLEEKKVIGLKQLMDEKYPIDVNIAATEHKDVHFPFSLFTHSAILHKYYRKIISKI